MSRKKRPLDTELFGEALLRNEVYTEILDYMAHSPGGRCTMTDLKKRFSKGTRGSILYYRTSRLERAKLLKIRSDGMQNILEISSKAEDARG